MDPIRVLLVDSNPIFLDLVARFLQQYDDVVIVGAASDDKEGLAQAQNLRPQVVVADLGTPGLTGLETISHLHAMMPNAGIIATSLLRTDGYRKAALAAGADDFIHRAALVTDLLPAIRRVTGRARLPDT